MVGSCRGIIGRKSRVLLLFAVLASSVRGQIVDDAAPETLISSSLRDDVTSFANGNPTPTFTTLYMSSPNPITTTSSVSSTVTKASKSPVVPPAARDPIEEPYDPEKHRNESVFNYYFLILALFAVVVAISLWWIRQRRIRRKEQMRLSGQNALAQDLDGWANTRRWMHGAQRHNQTAAFVRREEGLDEHGEAPPPYHPKPEPTVAKGPTGEAQDPVSGLAIPLRALARADIEGNRPPEYQDSRHPQGPPSVRLATDISSVQPRSATESQDNASSPGALQNERTRPND
jgi:hypothetical protein